MKKTITGHIAVPFKLEVETHYRDLDINYVINEIIKQKIHDLGYFNENSGGNDYNYNFEITSRENK